MARGYLATRTQYDNSLPLVVELRWPPPPTQYRGDLVDLTGITAAAVVIRREIDHQVVLDAAATVTDAAGGLLATHLPPAVTEVAGDYAIQWIVQWPDGSRYSFPATPGQPFDYLLVKRSIMGTTIPAAAIVPSSSLASASSSALLLVPDGDTGQTVGMSGTSVFAGGSGASVAINPAVEVFTIGQLASGTPWGLGMVPALTVTSPQTVDPSVTAALEGSGGDEVTLYVDGGVWYASTPTAGTGGTSTDVDTYFHTQAAPAVTWAVVHNLGYRPAGIHIEDGAGNDMNGNVTHVSDNQLTISFAVAVDGTARVG